MEFRFEKKMLSPLKEGEKNCFLLTNGLGGFCSVTHTGSVAHGDQALLMAAVKAPNVRWNMVTNVLEKLIVDGKEYDLSSYAEFLSESMKNSADIEEQSVSYSHDNTAYIKELVVDGIPTWTFEVGNIVIKKSICMAYGHNAVSVKYEVNYKNSKSKESEEKRVTEKSNEPEEKRVPGACEPMSVAVNMRSKVKLVVTPLYRMTPKNAVCEEIRDTKSIFIATNGQIVEQEPAFTGYFYFSQDERDGRNSKGKCFTDKIISFEFDETGKADYYVTFSTEKYWDEQRSESDFDSIYRAYQNHINRLLKQSGAVSELSKELVRSSDAFVVNRESVQGKTVIAGYPFFEDWGRDTFISLPGLCLATKRFEECKKILKTFAKYEKNGLMPNLFPEGDVTPMYNSVDAPLLFINMVYRYVDASGDENFICEVLPTMESIVRNYEKGTDYHIYMDEDGLICAGTGREQLTWMDVCVNGNLPTPRHGKPVEINAYWYSALQIMQKYTKDKHYLELAEKVAESFKEKFWNVEENCLKDVLNGTYEENQVRCNQIWVLTQPFTMLSDEQEMAVIDKVRRELYATVGLRTLSQKDPAFKEIYIGDMVQRDMAYHQGTVWGYPLGAYLVALIKRYKKLVDNQEKGKQSVRGNVEGCEVKTDEINCLHKEIQDDINALIPWLSEGCTGQIAEIYDGKEPTVSRGCFAQAWSTAEILNAIMLWEEIC